MAKKVYIENNFLLIEDTVTSDIQTLNKAWTACEFVGNSVILKSYLQTKLNINSITIPFADFQDGAGTAINTEATIRTYLSDKIG